MTSEERLPRGFLAAGRNAGIKNSKPDCGLLLSETPAVMAACVSQNKSRAACVERTVAIRAGGGPIRAILAVSGNANALTGDPGKEDDARVAETLAGRLGVAPQEILTAFTGVIGYRPPVDRIEASLGTTLEGLEPDPTRFAEAILTTDRVRKVAVREIFVAGTRVRLHGVAKGSGMVAPSLATILGFITTDAQIGRARLQAALQRAVDRTFNQLTIDGETSTNDTVVALANGAAGNPEIEGGASLDAFETALVELLTELAREIAKDGEGATRLLEVRVRGAESEEAARRLARGIAGSLLVKAAVFGADPNAGGRMMATAGAVAARHGLAFELSWTRLIIQGETVVDRGVRIDAPRLRHRMLEPEIHAELQLGLGAGTAVAWGCDLSYDYVKINADYAAITKTSAEGSVAVEDRLTGLGPSIKKKILIEALRYIDRFRGLRAVVKLGGVAAGDTRLEEQFAEDVLLLGSCGLRPIVVHADHQRLVAALNRKGSRAVGLSGRDGGLIRVEGEVPVLDVKLLKMLEKDGYVAVVSPTGLGEGGHPRRLDADAVAAALAGALEAEKLIFLGDALGLVDDDGLIPELTSDQAKARLDRGEITGPARPKVEAALSALAAGVTRVHLVDGRVPHNLIAELFTDRGVGTLIRRA